VLTFDDADSLVKAFFRAHERVERAAGLPEPPALNSKGFGAAAVGEGEVFFEYHEADKALECSALIYRFRAPPRPGLVDAFKAEAAAGTPTAGGEIDYEPENKGLFLSRTYAAVVPFATFVKEIDDLMIASVDWAKNAVPRVVQRAALQPK
jgi:hypothetical protein